MKCIKPSVVFFCLFLASCKEEKVEIVSTNEISVLMQAASKLEPGDIAIFDYDDVLAFTPYFTSTGPLSITPLFNRIKNSKKTNNNDEVVKEMSSLLKDATYKSVAQEMPNFVKQLQERGVNTLVLTQLGAGSYGVIDSMAQWRISALKKLGYNFDISWRNLKKTSFDNATQKITFPRVVIASPDIPVYMEGVLFAGGFKKEEVLQMFLKHSKNKPNKIFFIDDSKKNVQAIQAVAEKLKVKYIGVHYTAVENLKLNKKCMEDLRKAESNIEEKYPIK